jgi:MoxR-like ATPase
MPNAAPNASNDDLVAAVTRTGQQLKAVKQSLGAVIFGQEQVIDAALTGILSGGHVLLIGVPGLAKTRLVDALGRALGLATKRIQCTPDLMPADIIGSEILEEDEKGHRSFRYAKGPVFCQLLMADEINRASPRTQSALLQAMQEREVTVAGETHALPKPFHVIATQNPLEQEGTYPLPEAQLDRLLMQIDVDYPGYDAERHMLLATTGITDQAVAAVMTPDTLMAAQQLVRRMPMGEKTVDAILRLVRNGRPEESEIPSIRDHVAWGPGPRASQALSLAARARALIEGRLAPSVDDVIALARPVLQHRMALSFAARAEGVTMQAVIEQLTKKIA